MKRLINKYNKNSLLIAIFINALFLCACLFSGDIKYEVSDDYIMSAILSGAFDGTPNPYILFINVIWGYFLLPLYYLVPGISWYLVVQLVLCFGALVLIVFTFLKEKTTLSRIFISILFVTFFSDDVYLLVQFTKTAALLTVAGAYSLIEQVFSDNSSISVKVISILAIIIGSLYRFNCTLLIAPYILLMLIFKAFNMKEKKIKKEVICNKIYHSILYGLGLLICVFFLKDINGYMYNCHEEYRYYKAYATARSKIVDYPMYEYIDNIGVYEKLGISENDFLMLKNWDFADGEFFTLELMETVARELDEYRRDHRPELITIMAHIFGRYLFTYTVFWGCVLVGITYIAFDIRHLYIPVITAITSLAILGYFSYIGRLVYRVEYCLFLYAFICMMCMFDTSKITKQKSIVGIGILLLLKIPLLLPDYSYTKLNDFDYRKRVEDIFYDSWKFDIRKYRCRVSERVVYPELNEEFNNNPDNFYFLDFVTTIQTLYYDIPIFTNVSSEYYNNKIYLSGVTTNYPIYSDFLRRKGFENPMKALIEENVYLVDNNSYDIKLEYLKQHYYPQAYMELYKECDGYKIWKITKE